MGKNAKILSALLTFLFAVVFAFAQYDSDTPGKPCSSSFHCWRSEPVNKFGEPASLDGNRMKRLDVGSKVGKGGRCRCVDGSCSLYHQISSTFIPCEEF
ncbi:unnamed protein product [Caenorhabditis angaria]|uniref:Uncharacterized protein n=1 Tax=Caenorhabditis angaria TaxID=860376 RepID=A0A9P1IAB6_9PELO|nr:unnamed protein product [Caenorhabditis angaria]